MHVAMSSLWPPAAVWRSLFRKHYNKSPPSKWNQLYIETSCVLLGLKTALLVDCVTPSAEKLRLYLTEVAQNSPGITKNSGRGLSEDRCSADDGLDPARDTIHKCTSQCCILTIGEDTLLVNMECLACYWGIHHGKVEGVNECAQSVDTMTSFEVKHRGGDRLVYVDATKGLQHPKLMEEKEKSNVHTMFKQWLKRAYSLYSARSKMDIIIIIPCHSNIELLTTYHQQEVKETSTHRSDIVDPSVHKDPSGCAYGSPAVVELNLCTLFGQLLGYPVVYWFDSLKGYSLDMVELVCHSVSVTSSACPVPPDCTKTSTYLWSVTLSLSLAVPAQFHQTVLRCPLI